MSPIFASTLALAQIVLINVVLSGDNALVVALAARHLPPDLRRQAIYWGIGLGVGFQLILTLAASWLLLIPGLQLLGALVLGAIACRLLQEESHGSVEPNDSPTTLKSAIARIALADLVMSLDNVLAVAGVSQSNSWQLVVGLGISVAIILVCSTTIMALMNRFAWVSYLGAAILAITAAGMISQDIVRIGNLRGESMQGGGLGTWLDWLFRISFAAVCLLSTRWWPVIRKFLGNRLISRANPSVSLETTIELSVGQ